VDLPC